MGPAICSLQGCLASVCFLVVPARPFFAQRVAVASALLLSAPCVEQRFIEKELQRDDDCRVQKLCACTRP